MMNRRRLVAWLLGGLTALGLTSVPSPARAGSSLMCPVFDIGDARSLPWGEGEGWNRPRADYARDRLVPDTLELLGPKTPVLVRMETLRRANLYARLFTDGGHPEIADALLARLQARALDSEARGAPDPLAYFDAGYFAESLKHWSARHREGQLDGYAWVKFALQARGDDPEMEFAAVLIKHEGPDRPGVHWRKAAAGSARNASLARNMKAVFRTW
jgi:hypothetical protein